MSVKQMGMVWDYEFGHAEQLIMLALADHAHDDGTEIRPSVARLAWKTGYEDRQVQRILKYLRDDLKILVLTKEGGGRGNPNVYRFDWTKGVKKSPFVSKKRVTSANGKGDTAKTPEPSSLEPSVITPTGEGRPSSKTWEDSKTGEKQAYLIAYLHQRLSERGLETPTPGYKERLSGEARTFINRGRSKADLLFGLDHIVGRWAEKRLELWQAMGDVDGQSQRRLRAVPDQVPGDVARWKKATTS